MLKVTQKKQSLRFDALETPLLATYPPSFALSLSLSLATCLHFFSPLLLCLVSVCLISFFLSCFFCCLSFFVSFFLPFLPHPLSLLSTLSVVLPPSPCPHFLLLSLLLPFSPSLIPSLSLLLPLSPALPPNCPTSIPLSSAQCVWPGTVCVRVCVWVCQERCTCCVYVRRLCFNMHPLT